VACLLATICCGCLAVRTSFFCFGHYLKLSKRWIFLYLLLPIQLVSTVASSLSIAYYDTVDGRGLLVATVTLYIKRTLILTLFFNFAWVFDGI